MSRDYKLHPFREPIDLQIDYARELNEQQHAAVTAPPGPSLVIAGAGSGKTRTLTYRVAFLLEQGIPPDRILLLTFTNKAAREMMRRVGDLLGRDLPDLWGGTFHGIGNKILRRHAELVGYKPDFTIYDREDARALLTTCIAAAGIDVKATRFPKADTLADLFSTITNTHRDLLEVLAGSYSEFQHLSPQIEKVHAIFAERKLAGNGMDFDDLLVLWLRLLQEHPEVRELYQRRFQFVLVDEYQDTNKLQSDIIDLLAARHSNLMVVGDDAQSIYAWRGANFLNILEFPKRYPNAKVYRIETNYRSTPEILEVANAVIAGNERQFKKELQPARKSGSKPVLVIFHSASEQSAFIAQRLLELRDEGVNLNEMAVLYRSHFHALELQLELTRRHIPFSITSGIRFFEQAHIKDVAAFLKLVLNPLDELSFKRLATMLPGIGGKGADKLWHLHWPEASKSISPEAVDAEAAAQTSPNARARALGGALSACAEKVPAKARAPWAQLTATLVQLAADDIRDRPSEMIRLTLEAQYEDYLAANFPNHGVRLDDLEQIAVFARQFGSLSEFLSQMALLTSIEAEEEQPANKDEERTRLSTVHQAKGLEFSVVFLIMLADGMFPSGRAIHALDGLEEERRLFYVAVTRAKNELYLSYPRIRAAVSGGDFLQHPSRFLQEIPRDLLDEWNLNAY
jgi:DNA helicase-2/ATP-dependent DNA helicase PcrA